MRLSQQHRARHAWCPDKLQCLPPEQLWVLGCRSMQNLDVWGERRQKWMDELNTMQMPHSVEAEQAVLGSSTSAACPT